VAETVPASRKTVDELLAAVEQITQPGNPFSTSDGDWEALQAHSTEPGSHIERVEYTTRHDEDESNPVLAEITWCDDVAGAGSRTWQFILIDGQTQFVKVPPGTAPYSARIEEYRLGLHDVTEADARRLDADLRETSWSY
jgi:hypothetical protein